MIGLDDVDGRVGEPAGPEAVPKLLPPPLEVIVRVVAEAVPAVGGLVVARPLLLLVLVDGAALPDGLLGGELGQRVGVRVPQGSGPHDGHQGPRDGDVHRMPPPIHHLAADCYYLHWRTLRRKPNHQRVMEWNKTKSLPRNKKISGIAR